MHASQIEDLLAKVRSVQSIMTDVAIGQASIQAREESYRTLYFDVGAEIERLSEAGFPVHNPNSFRSLWEWYGHWRSSPELHSYQSRREYIAKLYEGIVVPIEDALHRHSAESTSDGALTQDLARRFRQTSIMRGRLGTPPEIQDSLAAFQRDHPDPDKTAFIMMKFSATRAHQEIATEIRGALTAFGISGVRADDKQYHDDLFPNILTYMYGCGFGIAVFERIDGDEFNPNVALEVGYMFALNKPVCLLKDRTLQALHADLVGKLYKPFDLQNVAATIRGELTKWLSDRNLTSLT